MRNKKQQNDEISKTSRCQKTVSCSLIGLLIGFLTSAIVFSNLPGWVPAFLSQNPIIFFCVFMAICATLGYLWAITPDPPEAKKRAPLFNVMMSGAFIGFLVTAVLYSKYLPTWLPFTFTVYPAFVFIGNTLIGALIGFLWHRTTPSN